MSGKTKGALAGLMTLFFFPLFAVAAGGGVDANGERTSRISDEAVTELDLESMPKRPKPILDLGPKFLGNGNISRGIELPTGAVWQPALMVFGTYRSALQSFTRSDETSSEWAHRLDLFANLQLTGSERFLIGMRPLQDEGRFTSYQFEPNLEELNERGWQEETSAQLTTFFFEGDFGELFPNLDPEDRKHYDLGFSIGRQLLNYQAGMLLNDTIDAIGVTRNTLLPKGGSDLQVTLLYGWDEIHRGDNIERDDLALYGLFFATDRPKTTINLDLVYVDDKSFIDADGFYYGISDVRRIGHYNLSSRVLGSKALNEECAGVGDGHLVFAELSWTPAWSDNNIYINAFAAFDNFTSAARDPSVGGPLGRSGILFQAIGLGRYGAPLVNRATEVVGGAVGMQWFISPIVNQFIFELGVRQETQTDKGSLAAGMRYRHVLGQHVVAQVDVFAAANESRENDYGGRFELRVEF
jgi:hypothetical protein